MVKNPGEKLKKKDINNNLSNFMSVFPTLKNIYIFPAIVIIFCSYFQCNRPLWHLQQMFLLKHSFFTNVFLIIAQNVDKSDDSVQLHANPCHTFSYTAQKKFFPYLHRYFYLYICKFLRFILLNYLKNSILGFCNICIFSGSMCIGQCSCQVE